MEQHEINALVRQLHGVNVRVNNFNAQYRLVTDYKEFTVNTYWQRTQTRAFIPLSVVKRTPGDSYATVAGDNTPVLYSKPVFTYSTLVCDNIASIPAVRNSLSSGGHIINQVDLSKFELPPGEYWIGHSSGQFVANERWWYTWLERIN